MEEKLDIIGIGVELGLGESSVMDCIFKRGLPAKRNKAGSWEVSKADLNKWRYPEPEPEPFQRFETKHEAETEVEKPKRGRKSKK